VRLHRLLFLAGTVMWSLPASAQVSSDECCASLLAPIGARALALGNAITARTSPEGLFANPALLANVASDQFVVHSAHTSLEQSNTFSLIIHSASLGGFALSYRLIDLGEIEARDPSGNPTGTIVLFEHTLTATFATSVIRGLDAGVSYKLYQFREDCRGFCGAQSFAATTHMLDFGVQIHPPSLPHLTLGASLMHPGFPLQVINADQASPTPSRLRVGAAYELLHHMRPDSLAEVWLSLDVVDPARRPGQPTANIGVEFSLAETFFLRAGYGGGGGFAGGAAVGVGIHYNRFDVEVAKAFVSSPLDESDPFQVSFGIRFGGS
jgi:hypothetical protein